MAQSILREVRVECPVSRATTLYPLLKENTEGGMEKEFENKFRACVEAAFAHFGRTVLPVLLYKLEQSTGLGLDELLKRPQVLEEGIDGMFGLGGKMITQQILKELALQFEVKDHCSSLAEAARLARNSLTRHPSGPDAYVDPN